MSRSRSDVRRRRQGSEELCRRRVGGCERQGVLVGIAQSACSMAHSVRLAERLVKARTSVDSRVQADVERTKRRQYLVCCGSCTGASSDSDSTHELARPVSAARKARRRPVLGAQPILGGSRAKDPGSSRPRPTRSHGHCSDLGLAPQARESLTGLLARPDAREKRH